MSRSLWFVVGAGAGVYAMVKARRAAETFTPEGIRDRMAGLGVGAHLFTEELRAGMTEKETELRERLGLALDGPPELVAGGGGSETLVPRSPTTGGGSGPSTTVGGPRPTTTDSMEDTD
jgi:hypothetical protein